MKSADYLDRVKAEKQISSDYALAKALGVQESALANYRHGRRVMDTYTAARVAELLRLDPMEVIAAAQVEREKDATKRAYWADWLKRFAPDARAVVPAILGLTCTMMSAYISESDTAISSPAPLFNIDYAHFAALLVLLAYLGERAIRRAVVAAATPVPQASS